MSETDGAGLSAEIARLEPREILLPDVDPRRSGARRRFWRETRAAITPLSREGLDPASAERRLKEHFGVATLDAFGSFSRAEITAAGSALFYVEKTQIDSRPVLKPPSRETSGAALAIDAATRANLELTRTLSGERAGSLLATIDCTVTPGGARLLAERLAGPLTDPAAIRDRQDAVAFLVENGDLRDRLRRILKRAPDLARALSRLGPRARRSARPRLRARRPVRGPRARARAGDRARPAAGARRGGAGAPGACDTDVADDLAAALADDLPLLEARRRLHPRRASIPSSTSCASCSRIPAASSRRFRPATRPRPAAGRLRVKHNHMIGYFVEVPQNVGEDLLKEPWKETFVHRQTMAGAMRFSTVELGELEAKIASAADRALKIELGLFDEHGAGAPRPRERRSRRPPRRSPSST